MDRIFRALGTPTERTLPGLTELPQYDPKMAQYATPDDMSHLVPGLVDVPGGLDLLQRMLTYNPSARISAAEAMRHEFFRVRVYLTGLPHRRC